MKFSQIAAVAFLALSAQAAIVNKEAQAMKRDEISTIVQEIVAEGENLLLKSSHFFKSCTFSY